jgi:hypothetical protein
VTNILPWPVYRRGKGTRYPLSRKLGGSQNRSGIYGEKKDLLSPVGIDPVFPLRLTVSIVSINIGQSGEKIVCTAVVAVCDFTVINRGCRP